MLWGLQLEVLHDDIFDKPGRINEKRQLITNAKLSAPRQIEFVCLKNRYGLSNYSCVYSYYPQYDFFYNQQSTWERVKGGFSAANSFNSNMNFTKGFGNLGKVTGFVDKTEKTGETIWLQFAN